MTQRFQWNFCDDCAHECWLSEWVNESACYCLSAAKHVNCVSECVFSFASRLTYQYVSTQNILDLVLQWNACNIYMALCRCEALDATSECDGSKRSKEREREKISKWGKTMTNNFFALIMSFCIMSSIQRDHKISRISIFTVLPKASQRRTELEMPKKNLRQSVHTMQIWIPCKQLNVSKGKIAFVWTVLPFQTISDWIGCAVLTLHICIFLNAFGKSTVEKHLKKPMGPHGCIKDLRRKQLPCATVDTCVCGRCGVCLCVEDLWSRKRVTVRHNDFNPAKQL